MSGAASTKAAARGKPQASTDFEYYRASNVVPGDNQSGVDEPSTANDGNVVLYTGNWYAAESTDSGNSFSYINPYTLGPTPTLTNGGFCCDQVAIHAPANGLTAWGLLYCPVNSCNTGDNLIRLAIAPNQADLASGSFYYFDFSAQTFGFPEGYWLDYPHFGVNADYLILSMNVFNGTAFQSSILVKYDLAPFLTGGWSANWIYSNADFTWTPTDNSTDSWTYWAATDYENNSLIRVYNWPPSTDYTHVSYNDFSAPFNYEWKDGVCTAPDANNWCAFDDSRVKTGGEIGSSTAYFMWDAKQGGGFSYPYIEYASFDVSTGPATSISSSQIWNPNYTWAYPGMGVDARGGLGVSVAIGGGTWGYPGSQFLLDDDVSGGWVSYYLDGGSHSNNRWGDFLTARAATTGTTIGNTWIATGFTLHDSSGSAETIPSFYWLGRDRDDPFAPVWYYDYANSFTEGAAQGVYTGIFYGPSNCACDYYAYNYWGDATSSSAGLSNYSQDYFALTGTHTYAEEGPYTTTMDAYDNWGAAASGSGSSSVADAALTPSGKTFYGAVKKSLTEEVATFGDADPGGVVSDYNATINWGDGSSSAGTIGTGFTVTGIHKYTHVGTYTVTTTINDAGGASTTATGTAHIGNLPSITSISPTSGTHNGGKTVTITGQYFTGATSVKFGKTTAVFVVVSDTKITVTTPAHATGTVDIRVKTKYGTSKKTTTDRYTFT
jgi:hypothetical protein